MDSFEALMIFSVIAIRGMQLLKSEIQLSLEIAKVSSHITETT